MKTADAIDHFGNKNKLAKVLGLHRSTVGRWGEIVPINHAWQIERISGGKVPFKVRDYRFEVVK